MNYKVNLASIIGAGTKLIKSTLIQIKNKLHSILFITKYFTRISLIILKGYSILLKSSMTKLHTIIPFLIHLKNEFNWNLLKRYFIQYTNNIIKYIKHITMFKLFKLYCRLTMDDVSVTTKLYYVEILLFVDYLKNLISLKLKLIINFLTGNYKHLLRNLHVLVGKKAKSVHFKKMKLQLLQIWWNIIKNRKLCTIQNLKKVIYNFFNALTVSIIKFLSFIMFMMPIFIKIVDKYDKTIIPMIYDI